MKTFAKDGMATGAVWWRMGLPAKEKARLAAGPGVDDRSSSGSSALSALRAHVLLVRALLTLVLVGGLLLLPAGAVGVIAALLARLGGALRIIREIARAATLFVLIGHDVGPFVILPASIQSFAGNIVPWPAWLRISTSHERSDLVIG